MLTQAYKLGITPHCSSAWLAATGFKQSTGLGGIDLIPVTSTGGHHDVVDGHLSQQAVTTRDDVIVDDGAYWLVIIDSYVAILPA